MPHERVLESQQPPHTPDEVGDEAVRMLRDDGVLDERPVAVDVADLDNATDGLQQRAVVKDLMLEQSVTLITGEEAEGKTFLGDTVCRNIARRERVLDFFEPGELVPQRVLFVDTEQELPEVKRRSAEMTERGLAVEPGRMFWLTAGGLDLADSDEDRAYIEDEIDRTAAELVWIDAGSNAVGDSKDDVCVRKFFNWLSWLMRARGVLAIGLTVHPRKRAQGEHGRRFDDLFGSREWKGRPTKALYIEGRRIVAWKDRGGHLRRRWPDRLGGRYPQAVLERPGFDDPKVAPFRISAKATADPEEDRSEIEARVFEILGDHPGHYSKNKLAESVGGRKQIALEIISGLITQERIGPNEPRAKLRVIEDRERSRERSQQEGLL